jgi:hypothetical protein
LHAPCGVSAVGLYDHTPYWGCHSRGGVGLVTRTVLVGLVTRTVPAVVNCACFECKIT